MLRLERRLLIDSLAVGLTLTLMVIAADASGTLETPENFLYDLRARYCQQFTPAPSDKLVHLDIDDPAIDAIGVYPIPRATLGRILDEVRLAGPKAVELDLMFSDAQPVQLVERAEAFARRPTSRPTSRPTTGDVIETVEATYIDHDGELAGSMARLGNVIVAATFQPVPRYRPRFIAMVEELRKDLELDEAVLIAKLQKRGFEVEEAGLGDDFYIARREAMDANLRQLKFPRDTSFDDVRAKLLPRTPADIKTGTVHVLSDQWAKYLATEEFRRFSWPMAKGIPSYAQMRMHLPPVQRIGASAAAGAFVDYPKFGSAVVRSMPLLLESEGRLYPQMGLELACRMLDADVERARVEGDLLIIPRLEKGAGDIVIPLAPPRLATTGVQYGNLMSIPWFGRRDWETMYDWPAHKKSEHHVPLNDVWQACVARQKIVTNNIAMDDAIRGVYEVMDSDHKRLDKYNANIPPSDDHLIREKTGRALLDEFPGYLEDFAKMKPEEKDRRAQTMEASLRALKNSIERNTELVAELTATRQSLAKKLGGKAVLMGWTATAAIADFVPTSLHEKCPGVVVHGVIFNGIMSGEMWHTLPWWMTAVTTFVMGLITSITTARVPAARAMVVALLLASLYAFINGFVLFDYGNRVLAAGAPLMAVGFVWAGCTLTRIVIETAERTRITRRFSNYVDPKIVDYVMENPNVTFDGERREMTVVFTDLAGFTAISERLGEKVVPLLNELFGELVPVIRQHDGTLNKFLGDGIMFFFNAPRNMPSHAAVAVKVVLEMHAKIAEFNIRLREQGLPELAMRAGVMTAEMIVGDAGGAGAADYTVLGDSVNTGSRLEAANKATGTRTLISSRCAEMLNGEFIICPVGKLKVVGKDESVMVYEPLAFSQNATPQELKRAEMTKAVVDSFLARDYAACVIAIDQLDAEFGVTKLGKIYRELCARFQAEPPPAEYDGRIILTEK